MILDKKREADILIAPGQGVFASSLTRELVKNNPSLSAYFPEGKEWEQNDKGIFVKKREETVCVYPENIPVEVISDVRKQAFDLIILGFNGQGLLDKTAGEGRLSCESFLEISEKNGWHNDETAILVLAKSLIDGRLPFQVIEEMLPQHAEKGLIGALGGGNFASEMGKGLTRSSVAFKNEEVREWVGKLFRTRDFLIETTDDIEGVQAAGAKNSLAILAGVLDGLASTQNTKAALMQMAFLELINLIEFFEGRAETANLAAGLGDLVLTLSSPESRNYRFGKFLGDYFKDKKVGTIVSNKLIQDILESEDKMNGAVVEGYNAIDPLFNLLKLKNKSLEKDFPLLFLVHQLVIKGKDPRKEVDTLSRKDYILKSRPGSF